MLWRCAGYARGAGRRGGRRHTARTDDEIAEEIRAQLDWDTRVDAELVTVSVEDGHVMLTGTSAVRQKARRRTSMPGSLAWCPWTLSRSRWIGRSGTR